MKDNCWRINIPVVKIISWENRKFMFINTKNFIVTIVVSTHDCFNTLPSTFTVTYLRPILLNQFMTLAFFYTQWKHQKTRGFLIFYRSIKRDQWHEMGLSYHTETNQLNCSWNQLTGFYYQNIELWVNQFHACHLYTLWKHQKWKHQKTRGFIFSGGIERDQWHGMG